MYSLVSRRGRAVLIGALCVIPAGAALAAGQAPSKVTIAIKGGSSFKPNGYIKDDVHFVLSGAVSIRSGGTVTLRNQSMDPHTLSLVRASDVPRKITQVENCTICNTLSLAHGVDPNGPPPMGPPPKPLVDVGSPGFDVPGDSIFVGPKGHGSTVSFKVTAKPGTTLHFMCIIHAWMQGTLTVK